MAEPAYQLPEEDRLDTRPSLRVLEGGGETTGKKTGNLSEAKKIEGITSGVTTAALGVKNLDPINFIRRNKKKSIFSASAIASIIVGVMFFNIISGPLQFLHLAEILRKNYQPLDKTTQVRTRAFLRYVKADTAGDTRLNLLGRKTFYKTVQQLDEIGVTFHETNNSNVRAVTIDSGKLSKQHPELKKMNQVEQKAFIAKKLGVEPSVLGNLGSGSSVDGYKFGITSKAFDLKTSRLVLKNSVHMLEDGQIQTGIKTRILTRYFNAPSLFHPLKRARAEIDKNVSEKLSAKEKAREDAKSLQQEIVDSSDEVAEEELKELLDTSAAKSAARGVVGSLVFTDVLCTIRDTAKSIVLVNRLKIVLPASAMSLKYIAIGSQIQAGQDISTKDLSALSQSFTDDKGESIWAGKSLKALSGSSTTEGKDISVMRGAAFTGGGKASSIIEATDLAGAGKVACSGPGKIVQGTVGLGLIASSIFTGPGGVVSKQALKELASHFTKELYKGVLVAGGLELIKYLATHDSGIPAPIAGAEGGNVLAYGARAGANMSSISSGGIELSGTETMLVDLEVQQSDSAEFQSRALYARVFDMKDYRSLSGRLIRTAPDTKSAVGQSFANIFTNFGSIFTSTLGSFFVKANAAGEAYDWGFPRYGIPQSMLDDPELKNPYENASVVESLVKNKEKFDEINGRTQKCFGLELIRENGLDVKNIADPENNINPNSEEYESGDCANISDKDWKRVVMFVFDTQTMKAAACFDGDEDSCSSFGFQAGNETSSETAGASFNEADLYKDSSHIACAEGTKDAGVQDGYTDGKKVRIRTCAVSNLPGTGQESVNGQTVVNSRVSGAIYAMTEAAKKDGVNLATASAFRTMANQQSLWVQFGQDPNRVARPGYSNHQMGLALDLNTDGHSGAVWNWLDKNASKFGYKNYPAEAWHWSPTGN